MKNNKETKEETFNKDYTSFIKGIAILVLLLHHLSIRNLQLDSKILHNIITLTKVCVALFTILSGYGMTKSYEKNKKSNFYFVIDHLKRLIVNYWWVYIPAFFLSFFMHSLGNPFQIYGLSSNGFLNFIADFFGLRAVVYSPTLNEAWWYMEIIIVYYLLFPLFYKCIKKFPILMLVIGAIPIVLKDFFGIFPSVLLNSDRELYYLLPFLLGIFLADKKILDTFVKCLNNNKYRFILIIFSIFFIGAYQFITLYYKSVGNVFYAFSIILFGIGIKNINKYLDRTLELFGKHSMNIFLVHSFFHGYFTVFYNFITKIPTIVLKYFYLVLISLSTSLVLEKCKNGFNKIVNYKKGVKKYGET